MIIGERYKLGSLIGYGGMGSVYRGEDTHTQQSVAIKLLKQELVQFEPELVERFRREGEALRDLNHPNIVKMLAALEQSGQHYLVMEYVGGGTLAELMQREGKLPLKRAVNTALELADALARAHHLRIIHRDVKPANILIADDGTPRLTDFGVARVGEGMTQGERVAGTLHYLSPESLDGKDIDQRVDVWAFGVLLFEMLTARKPFDDDNIAAAMHAVMHLPPPDLETLRPDAPPALVDLIYRMLEKDPALRIPSARMIGAELEAISKALDPATPTHERAWTHTGLSPLRDTPRPTTPHNLPAQTTPFVGREDELAELTRLFADPSVRLVTILGFGGMGKTRLAQEFGSALLRTTSGRGTPRQRVFADGIFFVPLAPLTTPEPIIVTIAEAIGLKFAGEADNRTQLLDDLRGKKLLLITDNWEHLISGAPLISDILAAAPDVKVLATSRERLNLSGENIFVLEGMDFPTWETPEDAANYAAVQLFMQSARRVQPDFALTQDNLPYMARICRLVHGTPLGILLSAGWVGMLTLPEIAQEIARGLDFLATDLQDVPERHRSLRAVFESSWSLLNAEEQAAYRKLSVFRGTFAREAAQAISGASLRVLMALVNKSLLRRSLDGRYEVHELLRQYAAAQGEQAEFAAVQQAHSAYYLDFVAARLPLLLGREQAQAVRAIDQEIENVRVAWGSAVEYGQLDLLRRTFKPLWLFYSERGFFAEAADVFERAAQAAERAGDALLAGWLLAYAGRALTIFQRIRAEALLNRSLELLRDFTHPEAKGYATLSLGRCKMFTGHYDEALALFNEGIALLEQADEWLAVQSRFWLANLISLRGDAQRAGQIMRETLQRAEKLDSVILLSDSIIIYSFILQQMADFPPIIDLCEKYLPLAQTFGDLSLVGDLHELISEAQSAMGEYQRARDHMALALDAYTQGNVLFQRIRTIEDMAWLLMEVGEFDEALALAQESLQLSNQHRLVGAGRLITLITIGYAYGRVKQFAQALSYSKEAVEVGRGSSNDMLSNALRCFGDICQWQGDHVQARRYYDEALEVARRTNDDQTALGLRAMGDLLIETEDFASAVTHYEESLMLYRKLARVMDVIITETKLAEALIGAGDLARPRELLREALTVAQERRLHSRVLRALLAAAMLHLAQGQPERAAQLTAFVLAHPAQNQEIRDQAANLRAAIPADVWSADATITNTATLEFMVQMMLNDLA